MELGMIGLGRMGANMVQRLTEGGHRVVAYDRNPEATKAVKSVGGQPASSLDDLVAQLSRPRVVWIMVPAGDPVTQTIESLLPHLLQGDIIIDGGNSYYKESVRRARELAGRGIHFLDAGTSGGIWGLEVGYCLMVGGQEEAFKPVEPAFKSLAPEDGYAHVGPSGAGHFSKMVHNGIEYAMMQAYAEGFEVLKASSYDFDLRQLAGLWNHGSVVRSWLLELAQDAFEKDADLSGIQGYVEDSGEGRWTIFEAIDEDVPAPAITLSLMTRFRSRQAESFGAKVLAALRNEFGGHAVRRT